MQNKSIAFVVSYLMGVDTTYLRDNFKLDYESSNKCKSFENYVDSALFRNLNQVRQSILFNFDKYLEKKFPKSVEKSIKFLKSKNIDLELALNTLSLNQFFNYLSKMIEVIQYKCLLDFDLPNIEDLEYLFTYPTLSYTQLEEISGIANELRSKNGVYVYQSEKIRTTLSRAFLNDRNLFYSIYSMQSKKFNIELSDFTMQYRTEMGVDIDETIFIDSVKIYETFVTPKITEVQVVSQPQITDIQLHFGVKDAVPMNMSEYLKSENLKLFVDCDNVELFKFLAFINRLDSRNISGIVLVIDEKSNYLWKVFRSIYKGPISIRSINVPRLKEQKSVVDVVLTKAVCESVYLENTERILLFSSDSDFFGLISSFPEIDFGVCYVSNAMGQDYLKYLNNNNIPTVDLLAIEDDSTMDGYKNAAYTFLFLYELGKIPMLKWNVNSLSEMLYDSFTNETDITVNKQDIRKFIRDTYDKVRVDIREEKVYIRVEDFEVAVD